MNLPIWLVGLLSSYGYGAVFALVGLESLGIPMPGETALISAAIYAGTTHHLNPAGVVSAAALGAIIGDNIGFGLGYWGGYRLLLRYGHWLRIDQRKIKIGRYLFQRHGGKVVFLGRFVSILRTYAAFLAGSNRMPWPRFLLANAAGGILWAAVYGILPYYLGHLFLRLSGPVNLGILILAALLIIPWLILLKRAE
ncbi:MAG: DedA family protein, partial [Candidatus Dormibacteraceae bacterium]